MQISTMGIDIAKNVFHVHGVDAAEKIVLKKQLRRGQVLEFLGELPPCLIGMEACATSHRVNQSRLHDHVIIANAQLRVTPGHSRSDLLPGVHAQ